MATTQTTAAITVNYTFTTVVGFCPKCDKEVSAYGVDAAAAAANLGRTCGGAFCEAYVDAPHMQLTAAGWVDTRR